METYTSTGGTSDYQTFLLDESDIINTDPRGELRKAVKEEFEKLCREMERTIWFGQNKEVTVKERRAGAFECAKKFLENHNHRDLKNFFKDFKIEQVYRRKKGNLELYGYTGTHPEFLPSGEGGAFRYYSIGMHLDSGGMLEVGNINHEGNIGHFCLEWIDYNDVAWIDGVPYIDGMKPKYEPGDKIPKFTPPPEHKEPGPWVGKKKYRKTPKSWRDKI